MTTETNPVLGDENDQIRSRQEKRTRLEEAGISVYPNGYPVTHCATEAVAAYERAAAEAGDGEPARVEVSIAGRLMSRRKMGKASFLHLQDRSGRVQIYLKKDIVGEDAYERLTLADLGDFLGVSGSMFVTRTGEVTVQAESWTFLGKAMRPLPDKWHGLVDKESRFRQRYLDLLVNEESRRVFVARTRVISAMRRVLDAKDFLEVETPVLQPIYGGASARPFRTTHNALGITLFLRIANELYLKRCLIGGLERVYEFAKDFRNEGMDRSHLPEFTMVEVYQAYADYRAGMDLVEELVAAACEAANGTLQIEYQGRALDFSRPWRRLPYFEALERATGADLSDLDEARIRGLCEKHRVELEGDPSAAKMLDELFGVVVEPDLFEPTFVTDHPKVMSPLSKEKPEDPRLVERYEPYLACMEVGNGFSELNDPVEQRRRFEDQLRLAKRDEDTMVLDEPFLRAMEHGMPPASGLGIGVDRLVMILTGQEQIREVVLFPQMRPEATGSADDGDGDLAEAPETT
ncbi:MAG: lysine--tRNA ligase [Cyanobacteria bacterium HKST-UBA02]|nr:lysine--tRNA ligase [Gemmatimonadota bacterium]MCA9800615.1 lysine--tRNA ligase [Cyanobacteria bacterium HKST-UBA02]